MLAPTPERMARGDLVEWHVVIANSREERLAERELSAAGYDTFFPHRHVLISHANRKSEVIRALVPRYLFIGRSESQGLFAANTSLGVATVMHTAGEPAVLSPHAIHRWHEHLRKVEPARDPLGDPCAIPGCLGRPVPDGPREPFSPGDRVRVIEGPLAGEGAMQVEGVVQVDKGRLVTVLIEMFRSAHPVDVEPRWLKRLNPVCSAMAPAA